MYFNSLEFWIFFAAVFLLYLKLERRGQNWLLLLASYVFYFSVVRGYVFLLCITTAFDFWCGQAIAATEVRHRRKIFLTLSITVNLAVLLLFKYVGFFSGILASVFGTGFTGRYLELAAPIGISFYILQSISYVVDVYRRDLLPHRKLNEYALYIAFFPQLLAGPIERAGHMLPQIAKDRRITRSDIKAGLWLCFWGLVEKCVIADNLQARLLGPYFSGAGPRNGLTQFMMLWFCCTRVYCDFDGYSNIARGTARMMGFDLSVNFALSLYTVSSRSFWRRFHITFYRWAKDYVFRPMVKNLKLPMTVALFLVFFLSGLWHEFKWTFICWGAIEASSILISEPFAKVLTPIYESARGLPRAMMVLGGVGVMRFFRLVATTFFLAASVPQAIGKLQPVLKLDTWAIDGQFTWLLFFALFLTLPLTLVEIPQLFKRDLLAPVKVSLFPRLMLIYVLGLFLLLLGATNAQKFVYFQF